MKKTMRAFGYCVLGAFLVLLTAILVYGLGYKSLCSINSISHPYIGPDPSAHARYIENTFMRCEGVPGTGWVMNVVIVIACLLVIYFYTKAILKLMNKQKS